MADTEAVHSRLFLGNFHIFKNNSAILIQLKGEMALKREILAKHVDVITAVSSVDKAYYENIPELRANVFLFSNVAMWKEGLTAYKNKLVKIAFYLLVHMAISTARWIGLRIGVVK